MTSDLKKIMDQVNNGICKDVGKRDRGQERLVNKLYADIMASNISDHTLIIESLLMLAAGFMVYDLASHPEDEKEILTTYGTYLYKVALKNRDEFNRKHRNGTEK